VVLALKLVLTPVVITGATLAGRRFGGAVSGWLIGLPLTSGPLVLLIAVEHGRPFASRVAVGSLSGAIAEAAFCVGYAFARRMPLLVASLAFACAAVVVEPIPLAVLVVLVPLALACALRLLPPFPPREHAIRAPRWDLPARMLVAVAVVVTLGALATTIGGRVTGLLAVYPLYSAVLAAFAQRFHGRPAAVGLLRGLLVGLFSFAAFYTVLAYLLRGSAIGVAFAGAFAAALVVQAASLERVRVPC
jgi:hypothetical protein